MKNFVIKLVKNNPLLYQGAKKVYRTFQPAKPTVYRSNDYRIVYRISDPEQMADVLKHYNCFRKVNTRLVVLVEGRTREIHRLFRQYPGVLFYSMDYYRTYQKRLYINNMIVTDCSQPVADIIELL